MISPNRPSFESQVRAGCREMNLAQLREEMLRLKKLGSYKRLPIVEECYDAQSHGSGEPRWLVYSRAGYKVN
jgi:hypothetical protein